MRLGIVSDIHGNVVALDAVLTDADSVGIDHWWALGDLVLFGPRPVEVIERLRSLPAIDFVSGNTDRYVLTSEQPHPHARAEDAVGDVQLVDRTRRMAAAIGWTQGALVQAGLLDWLETLPAQQRATLPGGTRVLGVHASPGTDDGPGIDNDLPEARLAELLAGCEADVVVGGHTHDPTDRMVGPVRALNPGSAGLPRRSDGASWLCIEASGAGCTVERRVVPFDVERVVADLQQRRHPNADFVEAILRKQHAFAH